MSRASYECTVPPSEGVYPVSLQEVSAHLRIDSPEENDVLSGLIAGATNWAQDYCWSQFITATWKMRLCDFYCTEIPLHPNPVSDVTAVAYTDSGGNAQTLTETTDWVADVIQKPGLIYPAYNKSWPTTRGFRNDVTITFTAGYGVSSAVPKPIRLAILMLVSHWYQHRTAGGCDMSEIPFGVKPLLDNYSFRVPK